MGILNKVTVEFGETSIMLSELFYSMMSFCFIGDLLRKSVVWHLSEGCRLTRIENQKALSVSYYAGVQD